MKIFPLFKNLFRFLKHTFLILMGILLIYFLSAVLLSFLKTHPPKLNCIPNNEIFITTNGVHLDIIVPVEKLDYYFKEKLGVLPHTKYISFGWGDKDFYINTPEWKDLTFKTAFKALFLKSETAMHVAFYTNTHRSWKILSLCESQLVTLNKYIENSFRETENGKLQKSAFPGYFENDLFYDAKGSFSLFNTCNIWVNRGLKKADVKTSVWSPFDLGVLYHLPE